MRSGTFFVAASLLTATAVHAQVTRPGKLSVVKAGGLVSALLLVAACGEAPRPAPDLQAGARLYAQHCGACHGMKLEGQPDWRRRLPNGRMPAPPHDESGHTWHHPDEALFGITKHGLVPPYAPRGYASDMPAFAGELSDDEIRSVLAWIATHWTSRELLEARAEMMRNASKR
jgi:mono/diheme cytochrome c family protein